MLLLLAASPAGATLCASDADCAPDEVCHDEFLCPTGTCVPAFTLPGFVIGIPDLDAYEADVVSTLDHTGPFYQNCCDTNITAFTGETADRANGHVFCPEEPTNFPACLFATCLCGFLHPEGENFVVNGSYASPFGPQYLYYAGHAGYDYDYGFGVALVAGESGLLCKALEDPVNGRFGFATAWDKFHTFYIDHGVSAGRGHASWYLHAQDLAGQDTGGNDLADLEPGECASVERGQLVGTVGNFGTGLPHLHFEVRRYLPADGPEAFSAKVVDPYGWSGATPNPWLDPFENPQAESQTAPLWIACGNGRRECGEACDDGNRASGDGCSAACLVEPEFTCEGHQPTVCTLDRPISGRKLVLKRSGSGKETLVFSSSDDGLPFPALGSDGDPSQPGSDGMTIEILSATGDRASFHLPGGPSPSGGWTARAGSVDAYSYRNKQAPDGPSVARVVRWKEGRSIKVVLRGLGLPLDGAQGGISIRLRTASQRACARFDGESALVVRDEPNRFLAKRAEADDVADCTDASLGLP